MGRTVQEVLDLLRLHGFSVDPTYSRNGRWVLRRGDRVVSFTGKPSQRLDAYGEFGILRQAGLV
jgi:hypothetical protein